MRLPSTAPLLPTAHQGVEYLMGLLLFYAAVHRTGSSATALAVGGLVSMVVAAISPGRLAARALLGPRTRRIADLVAALGFAVAIAAVTRSDLLATIPLLAVGLVLLRLGLSRRLPPAPSRAKRSAGAAGSAASAESSVPALDAVQPTINRVARAAGIFVRNRRARR